MNGDGLALIAFYGLIAAAVMSLVALSALIGRRRAPKARGEIYECGLKEASRAGRRFPVKFFLTALLFIVFDVGVALLFPWAAAFRRALADGLGVALMLEVGLFLFLMGFAIAYAWGRGALRWEE